MKQHRKQVQESDWYHGINFGDFASKGHLTPENWSIYGVLSFMEHIDFKGLSVIDVGAMDGLAAFIAEREGATDVIATDLYHRNTFLLAKEILNSNAEYSPYTSVEHLITKFGRGRFDVVIMAGLLYHVLSPLRTLLIARALLKTGGILLLESVVVNRDDSVIAWNLSDPVMNEYTTYLVPSPRALLGMMRFALMDPLATASAGSRNTQLYKRYSVMARAVSKRSTVFDSDLMQRAQERAMRVRNDLVMDELSLVESSEAPISTLELDTGFSPLENKHTDLDIYSFRTRFDLQPAP